MKQWKESTDKFAADIREMEMRRKESDGKNDKLDEELRKTRARYEETLQKCTSMEGEVTRVKNRQSELDAKFKEATREKEELISDLEKGRQRDEKPTLAQFNAAMQAIDDPQHVFIHVAFCGKTGAGKSSLLNAIRGVGPRDPSAAKVGVNETTREVTRYFDMRSTPPRAYFDFPGCGTQSCTGWQYFNSLGLFAYDCVVVVVNDRVENDDLTLVRQCRKFRIPHYIVRSKSDTRIDSIVQDEGYSLEEAKDIYVRGTQATMNENLERAQLPKERIYLLSNRVLMRYINNREDGMAQDYFLHEGELIESLGKLG